MEFTERYREMINVIVPEEAKTGKVIVSDGAEIPNWFYSDVELNVVLPSVVAPLDLTNIKPGTTINVTGKDLDLVKIVEMPNGDQIDYTVAGDVLTFVLPANSTDGAVCMIPASGVKVAVANIGMAIPAELVVTPATELRGGDVITITGVNMDVIETISFAGVSDPVALNTQSATEVKVTMPDMATSGNITLNMGSGATVDLTITTQKPEVMSYDPAAVPAGDNVTMRGRNLDLVASITYTGSNDIVIPSQVAPNELIAVVPVTAESGVVTLTMANGEKVNCPAITIEKPSCCFIIAPPTEPILVGAMCEYQVSNESLLTSVTMNGTPNQYILDGDKLMIKMPSSPGNYSLTLVSSNGSISYDIELVSAETTIWTGPVMLTWGGDGAVVVPASMFAGATVGTPMKIYFTQNDNWGQGQIMGDRWTNITFPELGGATFNTDNVGGKSVTSITIALHQEALDVINTQGGMRIQGSDFIINKITLVNE